MVVKSDESNGRIRKKSPKKNKSNIQDDWSYKNQPTIRFSS